MRVLIVVLLAALASSGCLSSSTSPLSAGPGASAPVPRCTSGVLFEDSKSYTAGGSEEGSFEVLPGCIVEVGLEVARHVGNADIRIASADHELMSYRGVAVSGGPVNVVPGTLAQSENSGTVPPGTYTYTVSADHVLEFSVRVIAA